MPTRMRIYQKLASIKNIQDLSELQQEISERFGKRLPDEMHNLIFSTRVKCMAEIANVQSIHHKRHEIQIRMTSEIAGARYALSSYLGDGIDVGNQFLTIKTKEINEPWGKKLIDTLENLYSFQVRLDSLNDSDSNSQIPKIVESG